MNKLTKTICLFSKSRRLVHYAKRYEYGKQVNGSLSLFAVADRRGLVTSTQSTQSASDQKDSGSWSLFFVGFTNNKLML